MTPKQKDAQARNRYFVLSLMRLTGVAMTILGIVVTAGRIEGVPVAAGYLLVLAGLIEMAVVPRMLARKWRTPDA